MKIRYDDNELDIRPELRSKWIGPQGIIKEVSLLTNGSYNIGLINNYQELLLDYLTNLSWYILWIPIYWKYLIHRLIYLFGLAYRIFTKTYWVDFLLQKILYY